MAKQKNCPLSGAEIKGTAVAKVDLMIDNDTKLEVRVYRRIGSNSFMQTPMSQESAEKVHGLVKPLARGK